MEVSPEGHLALESYASTQCTAQPGMRGHTDACRRACQNMSRGRVLFCLPPAEKILRGEHVYIRLALPKSCHC